MDDKKEVIDWDNVFTICYGKEFNTQCREYVVYNDTFTTAIVAQWSSETDTVTPISAYGEYIEKAHLIHKASKEFIGLLDSDFLDKLKELKGQSKFLEGFLYSLDYENTNGAKMDLVK
jgi:hypothetical protein